MNTRPGRPGLGTVMVNLELELNTNNLKKKTWDILRQAIHKQNNRPTIPDTFIVNGKSNSNISEIAEEFNNLFVNIGEQTAKKLPQPTNSFSDYLNGNYAAIYLCFPPAKQNYCIQQQT